MQQNDSLADGQVTLGAQQCACGKGRGCVHLLFVMLRVLRVPETDPRLCVPHCPRGKYGLPSNMMALMTSGCV